MRGISGAFGEDRGRFGAIPGKTGQNGAIPGGTGRCYNEKMPTLMPFDVVRYGNGNSGGNSGGGSGGSSGGSSGGNSGGGDISTKIAPPYDVLDAGPKAALLERDAQNVVAIDLPVTPPKTVGPDAAYAAAGDLYRRWLAEGVLTRDRRPGLVAYEQVYQIDGKPVRRRGLFAGLGVEPFNRDGGGVFRHEMTIAGGIGDRSKLMEATQAQLSPVFGIFPDPQKRVEGMLTDQFDSRPPDFHGRTDHDGVEHRCWRIQDVQTLSGLRAFFEGTDVFIADGHHRYTTALEFSRRHPELPGAAGCLFVLVAAEDPGLVVLPTHRVVCGLEGFTLSELKAVTEGDPRLQWGPALGERDLQDGAGPRFGLFDPVSGETVGLDTTDDPLAADLSERPAVWRSLDVAILHEFIIERILRPHFGGDAVTFKYTADRREMEQLAMSEPGRLGVVMRGTPLESVMAVSRAHEVMPPKSTFFYPKLATGLVIRPLD